MPGELNEQQVRKTAIKLGIPTDFVRKDHFVTKAIRTLTSIENEYYALIFQGGTSLSKGHKVINRLSEDVDFRVVRKSNSERLGKNVRRKKLREFRYILLDALSNVGFKISKEDIKVFYEGRYMSIHVKFDESEKLQYLKPYIAIDCFFGELSLDSQITNISSLVKTVLGEESDHVFFPVKCLSLDETAAEKWVALTRRIAGTKIKERQSDKHLVRHLYDLCQLSKNDLLTGQYRSIVNEIIKKDSELFEKHNPSYTKDPLQTSKLALDMLYQDECWKNYWDFFIDQMVYEKDKPSFNEAIDHLQILSKDIFNDIEILV